jgi:hypothetical protein
MNREYSPQHSQGNLHSPVLVFVVFQQGRAALSDALDK